MVIPSRSEWGDATMIGGNMVSWYGGFDSYMVAREIGNPIVAPSMGRKQVQEDCNRRYKLFTIYELERMD